MKKIILFILFACPFTAFTQSMHLPGAPLLKHPPADGSKKATDTTKKSSGESLLAKTPADKASSTDNPATGTTGAPYKFNARVLSTNFTIPLVRVNFLINKPTNSSNSIASTSFLTSAGAGLNYSWGEISQTTDANGDVASTDYYSTFGLQLGFLFAANSSSGTATATTGTTTTSSTQSSTIFAIVGGISVLNFQLGVGYELGSLASGQRRGFLTIAYAIPLSSLINGGYKIFQ